MFVNPGTLFIPLTPCSGDKITALHALKSQHADDAAKSTDADAIQDTYTEKYTAWANTGENVNYICDLGACIGASIPRDIDFEFAVELFTKYLHEGTYDADAREVVTRYRIATQYVSHPTFGPGLLIIGAQRAYEVTRFIDDLMRYGEVVDPHTGNAHTPVLHAGCVFDTSTGGVTVSDDTSTAWCEVFDATTAPADAGSDGEPAKYPTGTLITVHTAPGDKAQYEPTATYDVSTAVEFWLDNRHRDFDVTAADTGEENTAVTNTAATNSTAEKEYRHSDVNPSNLDYGSDTASAAHNNVEPVDIPDHTVEGYSMDNAKPFDNLLGTILRSVAAQIEQHGTTHLNEDARADRDATLATLTAAATMVENQAQHVNAEITDTVLDNLATIAKRMEAHNTALGLEEAGAAESSDQLELPLDDVIDDTTVPLDTLIDNSDTDTDTTAEPASLNPAEATLTEVATLAQMRIKQFINRAQF